MSDNPRKKRLRILSTALNLERIPLIGFGTYAVKTPQVIYNALSVGYRHLDLAENYNNLQQIKQQQNLALAPLTKGGLGIEVNEIICLWEGLFPDDQNYFQLHQIMDLVSNIPLHGSMHAWSELFGEQALAKLKKIKTKTNPGGTSYENYIMDRQVNSELDTMTRFYSKAVNHNDKKAANFKTKVSFDAETKILSYKVMQFHIYGVDKKK